MPNGCECIHCMPPTYTYTHVTLQGRSLKRGGGLVSAVRWRARRGIALSSHTRWRHNAERWCLLRCYCVSRLHGNCIHVLRLWYAKCVFIAVCGAYTECCALYCGLARDFRPYNYELTLIFWRIHYQSENSPA